MGDKGLQCLEQILSNNKYITTINLSFVQLYFYIDSNEIEEKGAELIKKALMNNKSISTLEIGIYLLNTYSR